MPVKAACHCVFRIRPIEPRNSVNGVCIDHRLDPSPANDSNNYGLFLDLLSLALRNATISISLKLYRKGLKLKTRRYLSNEVQVIGIIVWLLRKNPILLLQASRMIRRHSQWNHSREKKGNDVSFHPPDDPRLTITRNETCRYSRILEWRRFHGHTDPFIKYFHWNDGKRSYKYFH